MVRQFTELLASLLARLHADARSEPAPIQSASRMDDESQNAGGLQVQPRRRSSLGLVWGPGHQRRAQRHDERRPGDG
jgi:hypothetical protein